MIKLYNTRTRKKEDFKPLSGNAVGLYTCGPTVYNYAHIGNLRTYIFQDILKRTLKQNGFDVNHVMNITDVGHLTDDADEGIDKMEKGSAREGKTAWEIAEFYTESFKSDIKDLHILEPNTWCKATDHIQEQIDMVQTLLDKDFAYTTSTGIYFDTTKDENYGALAQLEKQDLQAGARVDMGEKKNLHDFALWKFTPENETRQMEWDAFGKKGFPGWHIECSAMATKYLGVQFDIHCGGIDHIPVHHTNEIAQTEAATGVTPWVNMWLHGEFLNVGGDKMSKSEDNFLTIQLLKDKGYDPIAYRYFILQAHYRKQLAFSWEALDAATAGLSRLRGKVTSLAENTQGDPKVEHAFMDAINDDLNTAEALGILQQGLKDNLVSLEMITNFDKILGLNLRDHSEKEVEIPNEVQELLDQRQVARDNKDFELSDTLRDKIKEHGFNVEDTQNGQTITT